MLSIGDSLVGAEKVQKDRNGVGQSFVARFITVFTGDARYIVQQDLHCALSSKGSGDPSSTTRPIYPLNICL